MRRLLVLILIAVLIIGAAVTVFLVVTGSPGRGVASAVAGLDSHPLLAMVPADATDFAFVPAAAAVWRDAQRNPVAGPLVTSWSTRPELRHPGLAFGRADVVIWRAGDHVGFAGRVDPLRAALLRIWIAIAGRDDLRVEGQTVAQNLSEQTIDRGQLERLTALASSLPPADALIWQTERARGSFPPIGRPSVTAVRLTSDGVLIDSTSMQRTDDASAQRALSLRYPEEAVATIAFAASPSFAGELDRLVGARVRPLLERGGTLVIYDVDSRKLIARPLGLLVLAADDAHRAAVTNLMGSLAGMGRDVVAQSTRRVGSTEITRREILGATVETAEAGGEILISFDRSSMDRYLSGPAETVPAQLAIWVLRGDGSRLAPLLEAASGNPALRFLTPKIFRSTRDANRSIRYLSGARRLVAHKVEGKDGEELHVVLSAK